MATICSWCGKKIGFFDPDYFDEEVGDKTYYICSECYGQVSAAKNGNTTFEAIKTHATAPELYRHIVEQAEQIEPTDEMIAQKLQQEQIKNDARQTNPLYDDIHQIAGDLRFIKNYLIFCIVAGIIFGFIWFLSML